MDYAAPSMLASGQISRPGQSHESSAASNSSLLCLLDPIGRHDEQEHGLGLGCNQQSYNAFSANLQRAHVSNPPLQSFVSCQGILERIVFMPCDVL